MTIYGFYSEWLWWRVGYDIKGNLIGYFSFVVYNMGTGLTETNAISFSGKVSGKVPNQRLTLLASELIWQCYL